MIKRALVTFLLLSYSHLSMGQEAPLFKWSYPKTLEKVELTLEPAHIGTTRVLEMRYKLECNGNLIGSTPEYLTADIDLGQRVVRAHLFIRANEHTKGFRQAELYAAEKAAPENSDEQLDARANVADFESHYSTSVFLAGDQIKGHPRLTVHPTNGCTLENFHFQIRDQQIAVEGASDAIEMALVRDNTPYLVVRPGLEKVFNDDILMDSVVSIRKLSDGTKLISYTYYFSDENELYVTKGSRGDNIPLIPVNGMTGMMARFGRHCDVEILYTVQVDKNNKVIKRSISSENWTNVNYSEKVKTVKPELISGTNQPILYIDATGSMDAQNNSVSEKSSYLKAGTVPIGYHLVPRLEVKSPRSREWVLFWQPWMIQVAHREAVRAYEKNPGDPTDWLFFAVQGDYDGALGGYFNMGVEFKEEEATYWMDPDWITTNRAANSSDRGLGMWQKEGMHAIHMDNYKYTSAEGKSRISRLFGEDLKAYEKGNAGGLNFHIDPWTWNPFQGTKKLANFEVVAFVKLEVNPDNKQLSSYIYPNAIQDAKAVAPNGQYLHGRLPRGFVTKKYDVMYWEPIPTFNLPE